jgi:Flp pilus assembly protein TadD
VAGRPLVAYTLALNYALCGLDVRCYHATNILLHLLCACLLFSVLRRSLVTASHPHPRWIALAASLLWVVHPLSTESVTYVVNRTELLVSLFYLLTLYCFQRGVAPDPRPRRDRWQTAAILSCAAGMACKEVMVSCPLFVLLYDRLLVGRSLAQILRSRGLLYAGLALTWGLLAVLSIPNPRAASAGISFEELSPWLYLKTQASVLVHYLRLSLWPDPLVIDYYDWPLARELSDVLPAALVVVALLAMTAAALARRRPAALLGAWFFLILAPTSSFVPIVTEIAAERRFYLPLAALLAALVLLGHHLAARMRLKGTRAAWVAAAVVTALAVIYGAVAHRRNQDYRSALAIMRDTVSKRPRNGRAHLNLGIVLAKQGSYERARDSFAEAVRHKPDLADAHFNLAKTRALLGEGEGAIHSYRRAIQLAPEHLLAHSFLANLLVRRGRIDEALPHYRRAIALRPDDPHLYSNLGVALARAGHLDRAIARFRAALRIDPDNRQAHGNLAVALARKGQRRAARYHLQRARGALTPAP